MPQKRIPNLKLTISGSIIERVTQSKFLGLNINSNLNWKAHLSAVSTKVSRVIGLLHKLKYVFLLYILRMIYNSLILPHFNYSLLAWGCKCQNIKILQKRAIRIVHFRSSIAHTEPILKTMNQLKLSDMYTCHLLNPIRSGLFRTVNDPGGGGGGALKAPPPLRSRKLLCQSSSYHTCEFYQVFLE